MYSNKLRSFLKEFSIESQQLLWHINGYTVWDFSQQRQFKHEKYIPVVLRHLTSYDHISTMYFQALICPSIKKQLPKYEETDSGNMHRLHEAVS